MPWVAAENPFSRSFYRFPAPANFTKDDCTNAEVRRKALIRDRDEFLAAQKATTDRELARFMSDAAKDALSRIKAVEYVMHWHCRVMPVIEANPTIAPFIDQEFWFLEAKE